MYLARDVGFAREQSVVVYIADISMCVVVPIHYTNYPTTVSTK